MSRPHVLQAVGEQLALNAVKAHVTTPRPSNLPGGAYAKRTPEEEAERAAFDKLVEMQVSQKKADATRKYPPQTRFLLNLAKDGTCGQNAETRKAQAPHAQEIGDWHEDLAASEPLKDLAYILRTAEDGYDGASQRLCAQGVGAVWRAQYPFRPMRDGDPYDVLQPHMNDALSALALDRARRLPKPPPLGLSRLAEVLDRIDRKESLEDWNLSGLVLKGQNLIGAKLPGADLARANLTGAKLPGADLARANLYGADLYGANLYGANLYGADLYGAEHWPEHPLPVGWKLTADRTVKRAT